MAAQIVLEMGFSTQSGKTQQIKVYEAKETLTGAEVAEAMDNIIDKNVFTGTGGNLIAKKDARLISTEITDLSLV